MLNSLWLRTFVTLCETGHFTRAAARLHMTQPGVSQHLRKLEEEVGMALIAREGKQFSLTPAGEAILSLGIRRRDEERQLLSTIAIDDPDVGDVSVACSGSIALLLYPHFLTLMRDAPDLIVRVEATPQTKVVEGVLSGLYDLGIVDHRPFHTRLEARYVGTDELCLILPLDANNATTFSDLQRMGFIGHPDGFAYAEELLTANFPSEFRGVDNLRLRSFINQIGQIPEPVARGIGYTILPRSGVDAYVKRDLLHCMPLAHHVRHDLFMVYKKGRTLTARAERLVEIVSDVLAKTL